MPGKRCGTSSGRTLARITFADLLERVKSRDEQMYHI